MTASYNRMPYEPFTPDEDEFVAPTTDDLGDELPHWRVWFKHLDATDTVSPHEHEVLCKHGYDSPTTPRTRRRWLDAILVGRLLRAAPFVGDETIRWEPFLFDITVSLDHFLKTHLRTGGNTEVGEAVMACVSAVPRLLLRLRDYDLDAARPAAQAARRIIFDDYVLFLGREFPNTSPIQIGAGHAR